MRAIESQCRDAGLTAAAVVGFALMNNKVHFLSVCPSVAVEQRVTTRGGSAASAFCAVTMTDMLARAGVQVIKYSAAAPFSIRIIWRGKSVRYARKDNLLSNWQWG